MKSKICSNLQITDPGIENVINIIKKPGKAATNPGDVETS